MKRLLEEYGMVIIVVMCVIFGSIVAISVGSKYDNVGKTVVNTTRRDDVKENKKDADGNTIYKVKYVMGKVGKNSGDGEHYIVSNPNPETYKETDSEINLVAPSVRSESGKVNYVFAGWYTSSGYNEQISKIKPTTDRNIVLYAKWLNKYTVKFNRNNGSGTISNISAVSGTSFNLPSSGFTYNIEGYDGTLVGWNTKKDGSGDSYALGQTVKNLSSKGNGVVTLYAQWKVVEHKYSLTYVLNKNGAKNSESNPSYYTISDVKNGEMKLYDATLKGYSFKGWSTTADGKNIITGLPKYDKAKGLKNYTLYGVWEAKVYTIKYIGDTNAKNRETYTIETDTIILKMPTQANYSCLGWYSDRAKTQKIDKIVKGSTGSMTLYAKWAPLYTIKYNSNKGTGSMSDMSCIFDVAYKASQNKFAAPTLAGYKKIHFNGWNTQADGTGISIAAGASFENLATTTGAVVTLYAQWDMDPIDYTVTLIDCNYDGKNITVRNKATINAIYGKNFKLEASVFNNNKPTGWGYAPNSKTFSYGQTVKNLKTDDGADIILYAIH